MESRLSVKNAVAAGQYVKEKAYWLKKLSGNLVKSNFYPDMNNGISNERHSGKVQFSFTGELFRQMLRLSNDSDYRLQMILAALPYTSTFQFDFDSPAGDLAEYCRQTPFHH